MKKIATKHEIASWKIDSPIERWLSKRADNSHFWKRVYVNYYRFFDKEYYNKGLSLIDKTIKLFVGTVSPKERKRYVEDMAYSLHRFGCMFDEYFAFRFELLNTSGRQSFITDKIRWDYYDRMNSRENLELFNNKRKAYEIFREVYKRELIEISGDEDFDEFVSFFDKHNTIIVKPKNGSGGRGIFLLEKEKCPSARAAFEEIRAVGDAVVEEQIIQAPEMAALNTSSVNTVRVPTLKTEDGVVIFHPFLRCGCGDSVVDNASSGGILAEVDAKTGIVITKGANEAGDFFIKHPFSQKVIPGFQIPRWEEVVSLVNKLAYIVPSNNYIGWDLALTEQGWIVVEGNPRGQLLSQYASRYGIRSELEYYINKMERVYMNDT